MTSVLVVDDDAPLRKALARELRANGYDSMLASGYDEALQRLGERAYDVLLTDLRMGDKDGLDLIMTLSQSFPSTRPILMSAYATARDSERAKDLGAVRVLCKPFDSSEMLQAVERAAECTQGFFGTVHGLSLVDMLQMFHYAQRSLSVRVLGSVPAAIHMQRGQIIHATCGTAQGEEALAQILTLPAGSLQTSSLEPVVATVSREFQPLVLDLLRCLDERQRTNSLATPAPAQRAAGLLAQVAVQFVGAPPAESSPESSSREGVEASRLEHKVRVEGLLTDACRRTAAPLSGDVVCAVVDLERGSLLGCYAANGDAWRRSEALALVTLAFFQGNAAQRLAPLLGESTGVDEPDQGLRRVELTLRQGQFFARVTRQGRRVMALLVGRGADPDAARSQLDAVFPLVEALAP